ncbi:AI-2E family transporter [Lachnobacterium bovis]|uniref:Predicted PurR-regulated permease PerM n=1 Tax=Lachnobacterium bovis TaxID=140626 RepID=A0A1H9SW83_9FIRM|nr:AI-2E family transporter [Lachnobacterium bovis]SER88643.1 Predicted PurR-regulated permease PerM [Lachnobacterium bovis]
MQNKKNEKELEEYLKIGITLFLTLSSVIVFFFVIYRFDSFADISAKLIRTGQPIIIGAAIAYILNPVMKFWEKQIHKIAPKFIKDEKKEKGFTRALAVTASITVFIILIFLLIASIVPATMESISNLISRFPTEMRNFTKWMTKLLQSDSRASEVAKTTMNKVTQEFEKWTKGDLLPQIQRYLTQITSGVVSIVTGFFNCFIGLIVAIYLMGIQEQLKGQSKKIIYAIFKPKTANELIEIIRHSNSIFGGFITGKIIDSAILGVICYIGCLFLNIPNEILVAVIIGVTNLIPFFGQFIGAVPTLLITLIQSPIHALYLLIFMVILQQIDGNIIGPKIIGNTTGLSSFWVMFSILIFGGMFGFVGMLLGVPIFGVIYYLVTKVVNNILRKKELELETTAYIDVVKVDEKTNDLVYEKLNDQKGDNKSSREKKNENFLIKKIKNKDKNSNSEKDKK